MLGIVAGVLALVQWHATVRGMTAARPGAVQRSLCLRQRCHQPPGQKRRWPRQADADGPGTAMTLRESSRSASPGLLGCGWGLEHSLQHCRLTAGVAFLRLLTN